MFQAFTDRADPIAVFLVTVVLLAAASELGFHAARRASEDGESKAHAGVLLGGVLAILGLLLAFSFSIVQGRFSARKALVLEEANAIGTAYLRANMLAEPYDARARALLRDYVDLRIAALDPAELQVALDRSPEVHGALWSQAEGAAAADPHSTITPLFIDSLNDVIDLHQERVTVALHQRLPSGIFLTLFGVALLAMGMQGYNARLSGKTRLVVPTLCVLGAIGVVLMLIVELDRPMRTVFPVSQDAMTSLRKGMTELQE